MKKIYLKPSFEIVNIRQEGMMVNTSIVKLDTINKPKKTVTESTSVLSNKRCDFLNDLWKINE